MCLPIVVQVQLQPSDCRDRLAHNDDEPRWLRTDDVEFVADDRVLTVAVPDAVAATGSLRHRAVLEQSPQRDFNFQTTLELVAF